MYAYATSDKLGDTRLIYSGESDVNLGLCGEGGGEHSGYYGTIPTNICCTTNTTPKILVFIGLEDTLQATLGTRWHLLEWWPRKNASALPASCHLPPPPPPSLLFPLGHSSGPWTATSATLHSTKSSNSLSTTLLKRNKNTLHTGTSEIKKKKNPAIYQFSFWPETQVISFIL